VENRSWVLGPQDPAGPHHRGLGGKALRQVKLRLSSDL
jgi:hypothetical protein